MEVGWKLNKYYMLMTKNKGWQNQERNSNIMGLIINVGKSKVLVVRKDQ